MHMKPKMSQLAAAAAIVGFLGFGGVSLAYAQDDSTTTTEDPAATTDDGTTTDDGAATAEDHADEDCPNMGEGGGRGRRSAPSESDGSSTDDSTTETPSAEASAL
jgi:hypothetical protein